MASLIWWMISLTTTVNNNRKWFIFDNFSCLLDSFFLIFTFIIKNKIHNINIANHNNDFELFNIISEKLLNSSNEKLNKRIWNICEKYKANYLFLNDNYKQEDTINQLFNKFNNFCFKYIANEGCAISHRQKVLNIF